MKYWTEKTVDKRYGPVPDSIVDGYSGAIVGVKTATQNVPIAAVNQQGSSAYPFEEFQLSDSVLDPYGFGQYVRPLFGGSSRVRLEQRSQVGEKTLGPGVSAREIETRQIPIVELKTAYGGRNYTFYQGPDGAFHWTNYPLSAAKIGVLVSIALFVAVLTLGPALLDLKIQFGSTFLAATSFFFLTSIVGGSCVWYQSRQRRVAGEAPGWPALLMTAYAIMAGAFILLKAFPGAQAPDVPDAVCQLHPRWCSPSYSGNVLGVLGLALLVVWAIVPIKYWIDNR